ncbi:histidinol dehydrogenase [Sinobaca qinghaiensis]|uniref:Histidinol dehydrogenase n=1 Tax=Sinobaca qinghaiensis TaxID=342944 RepID=A0A419V954_9BACL|nr:histidinol dehydrogenase [Sinobaca qinghaiensis]RKD76557.1 histidinol dehydrogenase [Sinobaca qinghaiensis]
MEIKEISGKPQLKRDVETGNEKQREAVDAIITRVREEGDSALRELTEIFDNVEIDELFVTKEEMEEAYEAFDPDHLASLRRAIVNIRDFHQRQVQQSWFVTKDDGTVLGQKVTPFDSAGVYVPGGKAAYPSTVMMNVIPAQTAGVQRIVMATPPNEEGMISPTVLVVAAELGIDTILKAGGAQAIAALAFGTESVEAVDKIVGPGNVFVALAKRAVYGWVDIDMIAGPSEIVVLADETARAELVAADMLSQAEHDQMASSVLVTTSRELAEQTKEEIEAQLVDLPKKDIAEASIKDHGVIYIADSMEEAVEAVNEIAPEHLEIITAYPYEIMGRIRHAGAIFLGPYSPEPLGDYFAGPNHVLPTNGTARFSSPLSVDDFVKKSSVISYSEQAFFRDADDVAAIARMEGLEAHARAVDARKKGEKVE